LSEGRLGLVSISLWLVGVYPLPQTDRGLVGTPDHFRSCPQEEIVRPRTA